MPPHAPEPKPTPAIKTGAKLVLLSLVAEDKIGRPVEDLTSSDLVLTEDRQPQDLRFFELEKGDTITPPRAALPAGFFSNRIELHGGVPNSVTILLFDVLNTPPGYFARAKAPITRFLHGIDARYRVAIYVLGRNSFRVLHDFASDPLALMRQAGGPAIADAGPDLSRALENTGVDPRQFDGLDAAAALIAWADGIETSFVRERRTLSTLEALTAIARRLRAIPGRKNLVWISTGFPLKMLFATSQRNQIYFRSAEFQQAVRALNDASVAVYPVDARGLLALADNLRETRPEFSPRWGAVNFDPGPTDERTTMEQMAAQTGGKAFFGLEADKALPRAFDHARVSYTLGYYPSNPVYDGKFRQIRITARRPGLRLSYRNGYHAAPDAESDDLARQTELAAAVASPLDATGVGMVASLERGAGGGDGRTLNLELDGKSLVFESGEAGLRCRMEVYLVQKTAEGKQAEATLDKIEQVVSPERAQALAAGGMLFRKPLRLRAEARILRVVVRNSSGALGSVSVPL